MLTKYTETERRGEIDAVLDDLQAQREPLSPKWVTACRKVNEDDDGLMETKQLVRWEARQ
jgi:hypothetical protein